MNLFNHFPVTSDLQKCDGINGPELSKKPTLDLWIDQEDQHQHKLSLAMICRLLLDGIPACYITLSRDADAIKNTMISTLCSVPHFWLEKVVDGSSGLVDCETIEKVKKAQKLVEKLLFVVDMSDESDCYFEKIRHHCEEAAERFCSVIFLDKLEDVRFFEEKSHELVKPGNAIYHLKKIVADLNLLVICLTSKIEVELDLEERICHSEFRSINTLPDRIFIFSKRLERKSKKGSYHYNVETHDLVNRNTICFWLKILDNLRFAKSER